jgi:hypothetical protein
MRTSALCLFVSLVLSFAVRPVLSAPIGDWATLVAAFKAAAGNVTMTLSPSFTMAGYVGSPIFATGPDHVIIEGQGATFDGAGYGSFFFLTAPLTVRNVTMKNVSWIIRGLCLSCSHSLWFGIAGFCSRELMPISL